MEKLKAAAGGAAGDLLKFAGQFAGKIWSGGLALLNLLSLIFIAPVVAFYVLRDWDRIIAKVDSWLPRDHAVTIRGLAREADTMIAGYMRGVAMVCLILAAFYGTALSLIGLDFGLVIGLVAGPDLLHSVRRRGGRLRGRRSASPWSSSAIPSMWRSPRPCSSPVRRWKGIS